MDFHIDYLNSKYSLTIDELRCLSRSLGFPVSTLNNLFNEKHDIDVAIKSIFEIMNKEKFDNLMNQTFNIYPSRWNQHLIITAILLLGHKSISFTDLNLVRCIYHFYEESDGKGLIVDRNQLLHQFKMCGRIIAPMKLSHRIKHMHKRLYNPGRLQLWEFLELIMWSDVIHFMNNVTAESHNNQNTENQLIYSWENDISIIYADILALENQNSRYIKEEWTFSKGLFTKILRLISIPIKPNSKMQMTNQANRNTKIIRKNLIQSNHNVLIAYNSCFRFSERGRKSKDVKSNTDNNNNHNDISIFKKTTEKPFQFEKRPKTAPIVSENDLVATRKLVEECEINMKSLENKYKEKVKLDMEYLRPGFWTRLENRCPKHHSCLTQVNLEKIRTPSKSHIDRMSQSASRSSTPFHQKCF